MVSKNTDCHSKFDSMMVSNTFKGHKMIIQDSMTLESNANAKHEKAQCEARSTSPDKNVSSSHSFILIHCSFREWGKFHTRDLGWLVLVTMIKITRHYDKNNCRQTTVIQTI
jgi:hypothetical protein